MCSDKKSIKCIVWDLDNTIWKGTLLEDNKVKPKDGIEKIIKTLDSRGILQSIASKNEQHLVQEKLDEFNLDEYFLYPQINWGSKSESIKTIAEKLNIGIDTFAFIDDQKYELEEVKYYLPEVCCIDGKDLSGLLDLPGLNPEHITPDSEIRRQMYLDDQKRKEREKGFKGPKKDFLKSMDMSLDIHYANESDLKRAIELTERTNQLNSTGVTYSYDELKTLTTSPNHIFLMGRLKDKFGTYGHIGLILLEKIKNKWTILLYLLSCRVISRGVGSAFLGFVMNLAKESGVELYARFKPTDRNRIMNVTYRLAGFYAIEKKNDTEILKHDLNDDVEMPDHVQIISDL